MFIEIRESGKRKKYYLVHSFRSGGKVKKIRRYLGANLSKKELEVKRTIAEKQVLNRIKAYKAIKDPLISMLSEDELKQLEELEAKEKFKVFHLSDEDWMKFAELFTYNTNAIEGSKIDQKDAVQILEDGKWPDKPKGDIAETYGVAEAVNYIRKTKTHISLELIKELHKIVFKNSKLFAGDFRGEGVEVAVVDSLGQIVHRGAPSEKVSELLKELVEWYKKHKKKYPPLVLAAVMHNQFENIHPFQDGNGRVGRLLLNNILLKHGLPPVNIEFSRRREYYASLRSYETEHNLRPTIELLLSEYRKLRKDLKKR
ncbi:Fic family protein [archaeon]|nr:Fic family protein [archaeon]